MLIIRFLNWLRGPVLKNFKEFALKGNVLDLAVGVVIGAAFTGVVNSLVKDIIMPPIGLLLKVVDFSNTFIVLVPGKVWKPPYSSFSEATQAGAVTMNIGLFFNSIVQFFITTLAVYLVIRSVNRLRVVGLDNLTSLQGPTTKECPFCCTNISVRAKRCPNCTSELVPAERGTGTPA
jgi:large conductance mechanosensitive channel